MSDITFGQTANLLKDAMGGASVAHSAIANNIANVNTPNFRRADVTFKEALAATEVTPPDPEEMTLTTTSAKHIPINGEIAPVPFHVEPIQDESNATRMRVDGSNVDVDQEMAKLSGNSAYAQTMAQMLQAQYGRMRQVISERA